MCFVNTDVCNESGILPETGTRDGADLAAVADRPQVFVGLFSFCSSEEQCSVLCSLSSFSEPKHCLHTGHLTIPFCSDRAWWAAHTFMQEMWTLMPQPNLRGTRTEQDTAGTLSAKR